MDVFKQKLEELNKEASGAPYMADFEEKTGLKPIYLFFGLGGLVVLMVLGGYFAALLVSLTGFVYPAYKSIMALESPDKDDDKQWLTYWTVYGLFVCLDDWSHWITDFIPHYYIIKLVFLIWLFAPTTKGAAFLYNTVIKGLFQQYSGKLDELISKVIGESKLLLKDVKGKMTDPKNISKFADMATKVDGVVNSGATNTADAKDE